MARELTRSQEYMNLVQAREEVRKDAAASRMMDDFHSKQQVIYQLYQRGEAPTAEQLAEARTLMEILQQNSLLSSYLQADARLGQLLTDIQKILMSAISDSRWQ